jgi:peptide/nickel transport system substrate-binding protein
MLLKSTRLFKIIVSLTAISAALLLMAGCAKDQAGEKPTAAHNNKDIIYTVADTTGDWGFPAPYSHYLRGPGYIRMSFIFDTLIWKDDKDYTPALAKSWQYNKDENSYTFELNDNVTWHDGEKFTAKDVVFTVNYTREHPYQWVDTGVIKKVETGGDYNVKMYLEKPYAPFLDYVGATLPILPEHIYKDVKSPEQFQQKEACIGTGPFTLADYNKAQGTYLYQRYDNYYQGKPIVAQIKSVKTGNETIAAALKQKQVNVASVPPELSAELQKEGFTIMPGAHDWVAKMVMNHQKEPLSNKEFRQALAYAVDRQALVDTCLRGHGLAGSPGLVPKDSQWYNKKLDSAYPYEPATAEEIFKKLGYTKNGSYFEKNGSPLELELLFGTGKGSNVGEREAELIKSQLEKAGIKINLQGIEAKTLDSRVTDWKFDLALSGHGGLSGDPDQFNKAIAGKGFNSARYQKNKELLDALNKQVSAMDINDRKEYLNKMQELYAEEMPALPLYYNTYYYAHDGQLELFYTKQGVGIGVPIPLNKMSFVK